MTPKKLSMPPLPIPFKSKADFLSSLYESSNGKTIPIGLIKNGALAMFKGDLDQGGFVLEDGDRIVVIEK